MKRRGERHARRACAAAPPRRDTSTTASGTDAFSHDSDLLAVVAEGDDEVVEVVLELGDDDARLGGVHPDPAPVRVGVEVEVGNGVAAEMTSASGYVTMADRGVP